MGYFLEKAKSVLQDTDLETMPTGIEGVKSVKSAKSPLSQDSLMPPRNYHIKYPDSYATEQELSEIEGRVLIEGYVLLWSNALEDFVAFYNTEADREKIPQGFVAYSDEELHQLFGEGTAIGSLRTIHAAKKEFGRLIIQPGDGDKI